MHFAGEFHYFETIASGRKLYARLLEPICQEWKLTRNELDILLFLFNNPEYDRAADIVSRRGIVKSHVSLGVTGLEKKGLLLRRFSSQDRRTAHLELTEQGRVIAAEARERQLRFFSAIYEGITQEEFEIWKKITLKTQENIGKLENSEVFP